MFNVRKSLVIAITVVMMLAMVVPVAMAAPEQLHGIEIDSPVSGDPAFINDDTWIINGDTDGNGKLYVEFTISLEDRQEDDVYVWAQLLNKNKQVVAFDEEGYPNHGSLYDAWGNVLANELLDAGILSYVAPALEDNDTDDDTPLWFNNWDLLNLAPGWYDLKVCAIEMDRRQERFPFCDILEENAVLVDFEDPKVWLDKPTWVHSDNPEKGVWLTGTEYLVGGAKDDWGLDKESGEFWYCAITNYTTYQDELGNWWHQCGDDDASWIPIAPGKVTCTINEWGGTEFSGYWDTNEVNDDKGVIRFCVSDVAGNEGCSDNEVWIDNEFDIHLYPGWNLISSPLMLYNSNVEDVLHHLLALRKVEAVLAYDASGCGSCGWTSFTPGSSPDSLTTIDHGKGYWIFMRGEGDLELEGTWKTVAWETPTPAAYPVVKGWNLIGYTQWGRPTAWQFFDESYAADYLANIMTPIPGVGGGVQALVKYNAATGLYKAVQYWDRMEMGKGYWLATDTAGTIVPAQW